MRRIQIITAAIALAFAAIIVAPAPQAIAQSSEQRVTAPKKKAVKRPARYRSSGQIACTPAGCHPIPRNCRPQTGYRWNGMPSGFDVVVCR